MNETPGVSERLGGESKKVKLGTYFGSLILVVLLAILTAPAMAFPSPATIDGDLSDWGLGEWYKGMAYWTGYVTPPPLEDIAHYWVPSSATCDWIVEDNRRDGLAVTTSSIWSDYGTGVHIKGTGSSYTPYIEPQIFGHTQPAGGEICDIEALYFDSDATNVYIAIIASVPEEAIGDLRIEIKGTDYAIVLQENQGNTKGRVIKNPTWIKTGTTQRPSTWPTNWVAIGEIDYYRAVGAVGGNFATIAHVNSGHNDNVHTYTSNIKSGPNWIYEISVPRSALDNPLDTDLANLHLTLWCANDVIELKNATTEVPEFTTIALPALSLIGLFAFFNYRNKKKGI
ncbi:MAG TPA: hypothetical protein ENN68_06855 [Methanomicrobia archaeon]|nr:hypothetical protein [Methanomicrobia archaeon]